MTTNERYPEEILYSGDPDGWDGEDNGTMPENVQELRDAVVGHRIVSAVKETRENRNWSWGRTGSEALVITLDNGKQVELYDTDDCCAYTELEAFLLEPNSVEHAIIGVGTTDKYSTWHIYADWGDILKLTVGWSCGNPFYYGYGFDINVVERDPE